MFYSTHSRPGLYYMKRSTKIILVTILSVIFVMIGSHLYNSYTIVKLEQELETIQNLIEHTGAY